MYNAATGQSFYYHTNSLGTVTALSNSAGLLAERYRCDVYRAIEESRDGLGNVLPLSPSPSPAGNPFFFTARRLDVEETSALPSLRHRLYFYRARYALPAWGRFLERDPAASAPMFDLAGNSPANFVDPLGLLRDLVRMLPPQDVSYFQLVGTGELPPDPVTLEEFPGEPYVPPGWTGPRTVRVDIRIRRPRFSQRPPPNPRLISYEFNQWSFTGVEPPEPRVRHECRCIEPGHFRLEYTVTWLIYTLLIRPQDRGGTDPTGAPIPTRGGSLAFEGGHRQLYWEQSRLVIRGLEPAERVRYRTGGECHAVAESRIEPALRRASVIYEPMHRSLDWALPVPR